MIIIPISRRRKAVDSPRTEIGFGIAIGESAPLPLPSPVAALMRRWTSPLKLWLLVLGVVSICAVASTAAAQSTPPSGPVHFPSAGTSNALNKPNAPAVQSPAQAPIAIQPTVMPSAPATTADEGDIRDIRGPISIPYQYLWAIYTVCALVAAAILYGLYRWIRSRAGIKAKLPYELALDKLEAARVLMTETQVREYTYAVSEVVRNWIEQRFGERAARRTTEEFLSDLLQQTGTPLAEHRALLEDFLNHCDLPKFARWQLSVAEMEAMHASARTFILETRPQPAKPAKAAAQPELAEVK